MQKEKEPPTNPTLQDLKNLGIDELRKIDMEKMYND